MNKRVLWLTSAVLLTIGIVIPYAKWLLGQADLGIEGLRAAIAQNPDYTIGAVLIIVGAVVRWASRFR